MGILGPGCQRSAGEIQGLAQLFDKYGGQILWDFQKELGIDVHDYATGDRGWVEFYAYLWELGPHTKFRSAVSRDPEVAAAQVESLTDDQVREALGEDRDEDEEPDLTPEGHTIEVEKLNQIIDKISILTLSMSMSKQKQKFHPAPRPKTEVTRLLEERMEHIDAQDRNEFSKELGF